jgi:ATP-grasp domain
MVDTRFAADEDAAASSAAELPGQVVIKAVAQGVLHKSAHGGVILDVRDENGVRELTDRFGAALRCVLLQPMAARGGELLVGVHSDGVFGPLVVFGLGGVDTDVVADRTARLAPLGEADTDDLLYGLRGRILHCDRSPPCRSWSLDRNRARRSADHAGPRRGDRQVDAVM